MHQTTREHGIAHRLHTRVFNALYHRSLLYNTCWEDPALDRVALDLGPHDEVLVITSAGCNALDYCLDGPKRVHAVDANPRQNALLDLKIAGIKALQYEDFFQFFGRGHHPQAQRLYATALRPQLDPSTRMVWDRSVRWFANPDCSFYFRGLSGTMARFVRWFMRSNARLWRGILELLGVRGDLDHQRHVYDRLVQPYLIDRRLGWVLDRQVTMNMLGVPYEQRQAVKRDHSGGVSGFVRDCLDAICRELPFWDNYFWRVYLEGGYTPDACPRYLTPDGFQTLKGGLVDRVSTATTTVTDYIRCRPQDSLTRLVLLDHMDWMGHSFPQALREEWQVIADRCHPDARLLFRSGETNPTFLDRCVIQRGSDQVPVSQLLAFDRDLAADLHQCDRVHTYASFHIARFAA